MPEKVTILQLYGSVNQFGGVVNYFSKISAYINDTSRFRAKHFEVGNRKGSKFLSLSGGRLISLLYDYAGFAATVRRIKPSLVHINPSLNLKAMARDVVFLVISRLLNVKVLVFWRGWDVSAERLIDKYFAGLFRNVFNLADGFCVLSERGRKRLSKWGINKPIYLETTAVEDELLSIGSRTDYSRMNILFLSRIERSKGVYEAVDAFGILNEKYDNLHLFIAGDGSELNRLTDYIRTKGIKNVDILGYVRGAEKFRLFARSHVYVFPSYHGEGMPNSVLEAMAAGLPVVTRPVGGIRDFFRDGVMGFVTESKDPVEFAKLIEKLVTNRELIARMGGYNREYARERFAASKVAKRLMKVYENMIRS